MGSAEKKHLRGGVVVVVVVVSSGWPSEAYVGQGGLVYGRPGLARAAGSADASRQQVRDLGPASQQPAAKHGLGPLHAAPT
jgi:hypothetical protein